ncbi:MAG TPA: DUF362 domain-containing protein [Vicinamibacteria bacterium]|nr:DUF362 domain-containing protein [Vicinamibacteria bacterium]
MRQPCSRRRFLCLAAAAPLAAAAGCGSDGATTCCVPPPTPTPAPAAGPAVVAITRARSYGEEAAAAMRQALDLLGGVGSLVRGKTVTVKVNFTGWPIEGLGGRTAGETYVTHGDTALALAQILAENGARRIRFVESEGVALPLEAVVVAAGWDLGALQAIAGVEFENTRNLGFGSTYARLAVPDGGRIFSYLDVNHSYADTDVFVSLCKMKEHRTAAGLTLSMKNVFGMTPNSLYGSEGAGEDKLGYRGPIHGKAEGWVRLLPGEKPGFQDQVVGVRVPRTIVDENLARPVHLALVDGIRTIRGGEGWWNPDVAPIDPGVVVAGLNALSTDAVAAAVMGFDPRAPHYTAPFETRENHLLIAEQAGLGTADLGRIDVRGLRIEDVRTPFRPSPSGWSPPAPLAGPGVPIG